jgi:hypothetical protein
VVVIGQGHGTKSGSKGHVARADGKGQSGGQVQEQRKEQCSF